MNKVFIIEPSQSGKVKFLKIGRSNGQVKDALHLRMV